MIRDQVEKDANDGKAMRGQLSEDKIDISNFGRHYLIQSRNNQTFVKRQYTVVECLDRKVYDEYKRVI